MAQAPLEFSSVKGVAQSTDLRGSQTLAATIGAPPLLGLWFGLLGKAAKARALNEIADRAVGYYETLSESAYEALGFTRAGPAERLHFYSTQKTPEMWSEQQAKIPRDWEEDNADHQRLLKLAAEGRLSEG